MLLDTNDKLTTLQDVFSSVSRETFEDLLRFEAFVLKWQKSINLIANATIDSLWTRHILDSAQIFALKPNIKHWCDIGSGGGFPAIVIAIFLKQQNINAREKAHIDLIESNGKKVAFLRTVIAELNLPAIVHHCRVETSYNLIHNPQIITARALASLEQLFKLCEPWFKNGAVAIFQKGRDYQKEITIANRHWQFHLIKYTSEIDKNSVILELSNIQPKTI